MSGTDRVYDAPSVWFYQGRRRISASGIVWKVSSGSLCQYRTPHSVSISAPNIAKCVCVDISTGHRYAATLTSQCPLLTQAMLLPPLYNPRYASNPHFTTSSTNPDYAATPTIQPTLCFYPHFTTSSTNPGYAATRSGGISCAPCANANALFPIHAQNGAFASTTLPYTTTLLDWLKVLSDSYAC
eukprot:3941121-Rhodomonas_salina.5